MIKDIKISKNKDGWYILWRSPIGLFRSKAYQFSDDVVSHPEFEWYCRKIVMEEYSTWREKTPNSPSYDLR